MKSSRSGSFPLILFVVFLVLRLTGVIDWSWWWVTSPLWLPLVLVLAGLVVAAVLGLTAYKVGVSFLRKRSAQTLDGRRPGKAPREDGAGPVVVEVVGSEVVEPKMDRGEPPALPAADPAPETTESEPGPERS